jgi:hypothetical protein
MNHCRTLFLYQKNVENPNIKLPSTLKPLKKKTRMQVSAVKDLFLDSETLHASWDGLPKPFARKKTRNIRDFYFLLRPAAAPGRFLLLDFRPV